MKINWLKLVLVFLGSFLITFLAIRSCQAQAANTYTVITPDSMKTKHALFVGTWVARYNDSTTFLVSLNEKSQILFGRMAGKDSVHVINEGVWKVKPNMAIAEIEIMWITSDGHGALFYHEQGDKYLFIKALKFYYDKELSDRMTRAK